MPKPEEWWRSDDVLHRFVCDLVAGELSSLRPGIQLPEQPWRAELSLGQTGLGCDSLELLSLATAVAEAVQMYRSGIEDSLLAHRTIGNWTVIVGEALKRFSSEITFRTSGSSGKPKTCNHTLPALIQEIGYLAECFPGRLRLLCAVPSHHIYGFLFSVLLPQHLGIPVVDIRRTPTSVLASELRAGDLVVGHPVFWSAVARTVPTIGPNILGVTSTAPCPSDLALALVNQGLARLVQVYGSSETSGVAWRDDPRAEYRLFPYWHHSVDDLRLVRNLPDGTEVAHGVPDRLVWSDVWNFSIDGRRDDAVQVGGLNVFLQEIRRRLCEHPAVADAVIRPMRPNEGFRLKAFIVPRDKESDIHRLRDELAAWCDLHLQVAERPKSFTFGSDLPRSEFGKQTDWSVSEGVESIADGHPARRNVRNNKSELHAAYQCAPNSAREDVALRLKGR